MRSQFVNTWIYRVRKTSSKALVQAHSDQPSPETCASLKRTRGSSENDRRWRDRSIGYSTLRSLKKYIFIFRIVLPFAPQFFSLFFHIPQCFVFSLSLFQSRILFFLQTFLSFSVFCYESRDTQVEIRRGRHNDNYRGYPAFGIDPRKVTESLTAHVRGRNVIRSLCNRYVCPVREKNVVTLFSSTF